MPSVFMWTKECHAMEPSIRDDVLQEIQQWVHFSFSFTFGRFLSILWELWKVHLSPLCLPENFVCIFSCLADEDFLQEENSKKSKLCSFKNVHLSRDLLQEKKL